LILDYYQDYFITGLIHSAALPVMNVPHDGMSLVDQVAHATTTVHPLPHSPKTQQWNLMNRNTFQYQSAASELMTALVMVG